MDELMLLEALEQNARLKVTDLADILNSSEDEVRKTIDRLKKEKVICGYHTVINWDKANKEKVVALIEVNATPERDKGYDNVAQQIVKYPEVSSLYLMSGKYEFTVIIKGKTMREVAEFVGSKLAPIDGVKGTVTSFVLKQYKIEGVPLEENRSAQTRLAVTP
ncbi:MAG: Lrp/AsnC family transcriptional regulator [Erysipelotrichaceae bacterium]|nr:Lrp/AsnC family transcriptional regulator [Erysipelotrichaceae bacterium]